MAAIAYNNLTPEQKKWAIEILRHHEQAAKWEAEVEADDATLDEGVVLFMGAAKWPDEIKFGHSPWNHKEWHFVDYPLTPPDFEQKPSPAPKNDIVFAIDLCTNKLKDPTVSDSDKANWLAWLIHLTGDITQPLHCCALVNDDFQAPEGDRGGNLFFVRAGSGKGVSLHKMWDDATGTSKGFHAKQLRGYSNQAIKLCKDIKRESLMELKLHTTPDAWARESWQIAMDVVYLRGRLEYGQSADSAVLLPPNYTKVLKSTAERRVALAGYRLASQIEGINGNP